MNNKEATLSKIVDIVVDCCATDINGTPSLTREEVLGSSRKENVVMTRCILAHMILSAGYSVTTCAQLMNRTAPAIRHMMEQGHNFIQTSRAFRIANAEATLRCRDLGADTI